MAFNLVKRASDRILSKSLHYASFCHRTRLTQHKMISSANVITKKIEAVFVDLSGTIHIDDTAIQGAQEALERLQASNVKIKYVTNTTKESLRNLHDKISKLGFNIKKEEIFTSLTAARSLIEAKNLRPLLLLEDVAKEDFAGIPTDNPNAVVVGLAPSCFNYEYLSEAFRLLLEGAPLIAVHKARYYKQSDGKLYLGPGPFVTGLEYATDSRAEVVGKPEKTFFLEAAKEFGVEAENIVMIGDDVRDDVGGAMNCGMMGILVKTGKYRPGDETKTSSPPTSVCADFPAAVDFILTNL